MNRSSQAEKPHSLLNEIETQIRALQELSRFYCGADGAALLNQLPTAGRYLFVENDAGGSSAALAARLCTSQGIDAAAVEADELVHWSRDLCTRFDRVFLFAPDINEIHQKTLSADRIVLVTSSPKVASTQAGMILPTFCSEEIWPGSQSFLAERVLAWLLSRHLSHHRDGNETDQLKRLRQRIQLLIEGRQALLEQWRHCLEGSNFLILSGSGLQSLIAAQAALSLMLWTDMPATVLPRQIPIAPSQPGTKHILLLDAVNLQPDSISLIDGYPLLPADPPRPTTGLNTELSCNLNWVSLQILASGFIEGKV